MLYFQSFEEELINSCLDFIDEIDNCGVTTVSTAFEHLINTHNRHNRYWL